MVQVVVVAVAVVAGLAALDLLSRAGGSLGDPPGHRGSSSPEGGRSRTRNGNKKTVETVIRRKCTRNSNKCTRNSNKKKVEKVELEEAERGGSGTGGQKNRVSFHL